MRGLLYLAWRYLAYHRVKSATLLAVTAIIVYLPIALNILVARSAHELNLRAETTPLLVGAKGSPLELVLSSLYFDFDQPPSTSFRQVARIQASTPLPRLSIRPPL